MWIQKHGKHYRKRQTGAGVRHMLCRILDNFTARVAGRHSRTLRRLRARLNNRT